MKNLYNNPYINYYNAQVGTGITGFSGVRYQRGYGIQGYSGIRFQRGSGIFGRVFSWIGNFIKDLAPKVAKRALPSAVSFAQDVIGGENVGQSAKKRLIEAGKNVADETLEHIKSKVQSGSGISTRKHRRTSHKRNYKMRKVNISKQRIKKKRRKNLYNFLK